MRMQHEGRTWRRSIAAGCFAALLAAAACAASPDYAWVEGEKPASADFAWKEAGVEKSELLSENRWLLIAERGKTPENGWNLSYRVRVPRSAVYNLWLRIGFEWIRPSVLWRLDEGRWTGVGVPPKEAAGEGGGRRPARNARWKFDVYRRTTNLKELGFWNEVAWLQLGSQELSAGDHLLQLKFVEGRTDEPLLAVDAICFVHGLWTPEGQLKPGRQYDAEDDRRAAAQVFSLPEASGPGRRVSVELSGLWQAARYDDPDMDANPYEPVTRIPGPDEYQLSWMGVRVPGALWNHKEMAFAHRVIYRTKARVPAEHAGRAFHLHFSGTNWIASVLVNGRYVGFRRSVWIPWDMDITPYVRPGEVNEIAVGVKGPYYAFDREGWAKGGLEETRNRPYTYRKNARWIAPIYPSTKGDGDGYMHGVVNPVTLFSTGDAYTEDVFVKPSVERKEIVADITVRNTQSSDRKVQIVCEAVYDANDEVEKTFGPVDLAAPAGGVATATVRGAWADPKLWWPLPNPHLYRWRTRILENGRTVDIHEQLFGFREVTIDGPSIRINGIRRNLWNWVDVAGGAAASGEDWAERFREEGDRFMRFSYGRKITSALPSREERLEFYDRHGIPGRLCSMIDGMFISYRLGDRRRDGVLDVNEPLWENFREHIAQLTKAYRNHPSVIMYQIENELVYINGMNVYGAYLDQVEREMMKVYLAGRANDPTRPYTVGGGGDLRHAEGMKGKTLEINCPHYPRAIEDYYPDDAYRITQYSSKIARWPWTRMRPWLPGESLYDAEIELGTYAAGPRAGRSRKDALEAKARFLRAMYEGYRWAGAAGFCPWCNLSETDDGEKTFSELTAIPRKRTHRLFGGRENRLLYKVLNDAFSREPVTFQWSYRLGERLVAGGTKELAIEPGFGKEQWLTITPPRVAERAEGVLQLKVSQRGAKDFVDETIVPVLPAVDSIRLSAPVLLYDKSGKVGPYLDRAGVVFAALENLASLRGRSGLLVVGPDTLSAREAFGAELLKFSIRGNQVICLEQEYAPAGGSVPAPLRTTSRFGGYAHPQALGGPVFRDLGREDLSDWAGEHPTYKNAYLKPSRGGRSLVECGAGLPFSALVEMGAGDGMMVLCQLRVGAKLGVDPAADILLRNLIETYAGRHPSKADAAIFAPQNPLLTETILATGVLARPVDDLEQALDAGKHRAAVIAASRRNLQSLIQLRRRADDFQQAGGWIMLCGVTPESIDAMNSLLGVHHLLRPFRIERVVLQNPDHPLAASLSDADVMLYSTDALAAWKRQYWASGDTFSYVIDGRDAAPFTFPPGAPHDPYAYQPTKNDKDPYNFVNGMVSADSWRTIRQIWVEKGAGASAVGLEHVFTLRRPETIRRVNIWNDAAYSTIENLDIVFDGDKSSAVSTVLPDSDGLTEIQLPEPRRVERSITLVIKSWRVRPHKNPQAKNLVGIANVQFLRESPPSFGTPLDSAGGLVAFPKGRGGVFLNQIKFIKQESNPVNSLKKANLVATILQNMGVGARTSTVAVPGYNLRYETVDITDPCNAFLAEHDGRPGWFGEKGRDLRSLPKGRRHFADVLYHVVDYATAPVPDCILLSARGGDREVRGIEVGGKTADVLFFLHAADVRRPLTEQERAKMNDKKRPFSLPVLAQYVIHYADGEKASIPVVLEKDVDHWRQQNPRPLENAMIAWSASLAESSPSEKAVLYGMKVPNPRPHSPIRSIDVVLPRDKMDRAQNRADFGVVAVTLGTVLAK